MSRWKPGDVAMVSALNKTEPYRAYFDGKTWREYGGAMFCVDSPHTIRPLIVIDPEDREQVRELAKSLNAHGLAFCNPGDIAAALREFANPTPPKPDEPKGVGAIVTASYQDDDGKGFGPATWASREDGTWVCLTDGLSAVALWPFLRDPALVREGVTE